jgi:hypothetical protein
VGQILFYAVPEADSTIERFGGELYKVLYERKKAVKVAITGPSAGLEETNKRQPKTTYEKVAELKALLAKRGELGSARPTGASESFILERCHAVRVIVPKNANVGNQSPPLSFWISLGDERHGPLCLFEGSGGDLENPYNYGRASTYTLLQSLVHFARRQRRSDVPDRFIPNDSHPNEYVKIDETHPPSLIEQYHNVTKGHLDYDFVSDPLKILGAWGSAATRSRRSWPPPPSPRSCFKHLQL